MPAFARREDSSTADPWQAGTYLAIIFVLFALGMGTAMWKRIRNTRREARRRQVRDERRLEVPCIWEVDVAPTKGRMRIAPAEWTYWQASSIPWCATFEGRSNVEGNSHLLHIRQVHPLPLPQDHRWTAPRKCPLTLAK